MNFLSDQGIVSSGLQLRMEIYVNCLYARRLIRRV